MNVKRAFERVPVDREAEERAWARRARCVRGARAGSRSSAPAAHACRRGSRRSCCRGRSGVLAARARGRRRRSPHDRHLACGAGALPAARSRARARERQRRDVGRSGGRLEAAARRLHRGGVVAARAVRDRRVVDRARGDRAGQRRRALVARAAEACVPALGRLAHRHARRVPQRGAAACRRGRRHRRCGRGRDVAGRAGVASRRPAAARVRCERRARPPARRMALVAALRRRARARLVAGRQLAPACHRAGARALRRRVRSRSCLAGARRQRGRVLPRRSSSRLCGGMRCSSFSTAARRERCSPAPGRLRGVAWSPNGRWLLTALPPPTSGSSSVGATSLPFRTLRASSAGCRPLDGWVTGP